MQPWLVVAPLLAACGQSVEDRIAELDSRVTVDCGSVGECATPAYVDGVIACMRDNLAANVAAKGVFILGLDPVAEVFALDGAFVSVEGYYLDGDELFTEYRCRDVESEPGPGPAGACVQARAIDCQVVREW